MKTLITLAALMLASCFSGAQTTPFTQSSNQFCTFQDYAFVPGVITHRFTCSVIPATVNGTVNVYQSFYADLSPNVDNTGGTLIGQFWIDSSTRIDVTGTYAGSLDSGTSATITSTHLEWATGHVDSVYGTHQVGCGRNCVRTKRYLIAGSGLE